MNTMLSSGSAALVRWIMFVCIVSSVAGCGASSAPVTSADGPRQTPLSVDQPTPAVTPAVTPANVAAEQETEALSARAEDQQLDDDGVVQGQPNATAATATAVGSSQTPGVGASNGPTVSATPTPAAADPPKVAPRPQPTPVQIAQWTPPEYEPLQLLACRAAAASAFVAKLGHTPDGRHLVLAGLQVSLWSVDGDEPEHVFLETSGARQITSLAVAPDGKWFAAGDSEGTLRIWNIADRAELVSKPLMTTALTDIAISPDSAELAVISYNNEISVWTADTLQPKNRFQVDTNNLKKIVYLTSATLAAAGETTTSWNVNTGALEQTLSTGRYNYSLARSPDNARLVYGQNDVLLFWNIAEARQDGKLSGGVATNELVAFSPDGRQLAMANGASVRIRDIATDQLLQVLDTYGAPIVGLDWLPQTNLLVVASENSRVRLWGTSAAAEALQMSPLHTAVALPDTAEPGSATLAQLEQLLDLRTFPRIPGSTARASTAFSLNASVPVDPQTAILFYRYQLTSAGWRESADSPPTPGALQFHKNGFRLAASFYEEGPAATSASISLRGNYSLQQIPKFDAAPIEMVFENPDVVIYRTTADLLQIETTLLRAVHAVGWTPYARLHASHTENADARNLEFLRDGLLLRISIGRVPTDPTSFNIQYSLTLTTRSLPVPPDAGFVEFDGSTQPYLVATTSLNLQQATEFYDQEMMLQGWLVRDFGRSLTETQHWMSYVRGQRELRLGLQLLPSGRTLVRVGDKLENASWQLARLQPADSTDEPADGLEAADLPLLNEFRSAKFDAIAKTVDIPMAGTPLAEVAERYTKAMQTVGWTWDGGGIKSEDYVFLTFTRGKAEIALRARMSDGKATVNFQGDGILWTKPLPGGKQRISYEAWLRSNQHPATLDLIDTYLQEMRATNTADGPQ